MTCIIPSELEWRLAARAAERNTTVEQIVSEAISTYLAAADSSDRVESSDSLEAFRALQHAASVTPQRAAEWKAAIQDLRR